MVHDVLSGCNLITSCSHIDFVHTYNAFSVTVNFVFLFSNYTIMTKNKLPTWHLDRISYQIE